MLDNTGYLLGQDSDTGFEDRDGLVVSSCGHYRLLTLERYEIRRPEGRRDWQLLYLAGGRGAFLVEGEERLLEAGSGVLYAPGEAQWYTYWAAEKTEVYWMHFSGRQARPMLEGLGLLASRPWQAGVRERYRALFEELIRELQLQPEGFSWMTAGLAQELLAELCRGMGRQSARRGEDQVIRRALEEMHRSYREGRTVEDYARAYNMSLCWFSRRFKACTGVSPNRYLINIRMSRARELLLDTPLNVGEVAAMVGYDNPLYFSRLFKKHTGLSPRFYRESAGAGQLAFSARQSPAGG